MSQKKGISREHTKLFFVLLFVCLVGLLLLLSIQVILSQTSLLL